MKKHECYKLSAAKMMVPGLQALAHHAINFRTVHLSTLCKLLLNKKAKSSTKEASRMLVLARFLCQVPVI
jgi:hypothetical protein